MLKKHGSLILLSSMLFALPLAARAQSETQLVDKYTTFAGSDANAKSLVTGLHDGREVKLTSGSTTTSFTPPTGKMGNGNVNIALALADASLKQQGITNPTPDQLKTTLSGILQQRADGKGWGRSRTRWASSSATSCAPRKPTRSRRIAAHATSMQTVPGVRKGPSALSGRSVPRSPSAAAAEAGRGEQEQ